MQERFAHFLGNLILLALLDCDRYRIIQVQFVFSDESCADPDNFFPGGFRDIFLEF